MGRSMNFIVGGVLVVVVAVAATTIYANWNEAVQIVSMGGQLYPLYGRTGRNDLHRGRGRLQQPMPTRQNSSVLANGADPGQDDWPSYSKTLTSNRFSSLNQITAANAGDLKVLCTYDTGQYTGIYERLAEGRRRPDFHDRI